MNDENDKSPEFKKKYIAPVIYIALAIILTVVIIFILIGARDFVVNREHTKLLKIFTPFTIGLAIAYLLNPLLLFFENKVFGNIGKNRNKKKTERLGKEEVLEKVAEEKEKKNKKIGRGLSLLSTYLSTTLLITLLMLMVVPQVGTSVRQLAAIVTGWFEPYEYENEVENGNGNEELDKQSGVQSADNDKNEQLPEGDLSSVLEIEIDRNSLMHSKIGVYARDLAASVQEYIDNLGIQLDIEETFNDYFLQFTANIVDFSLEYVEPAFNATASVVAGTASWIMNILLGIIISIYMLINKDKLIAQVKKLLYAIFPETFAHKTVNVTRKTHEIFGGFLSGKLLDSFIIGIICFVVMSIFGIEYALLISIIVGVTNIIPFFGPFIGAIPSVFFLMTVDIWQAVWFIVFIIILQQFDGNYLGPKILGSTIGLSPFWIIFSVIVMNGLFGIFGMFVGVPLFAIIYTLVKEFAENRLSKKELPIATDEYVLYPAKPDKIIISEPTDKDDQATKQENILDKIKGLAEKLTKRINKSRKDETDADKD